MAKAKSHENENKASCSPAVNEILVVGEEVERPPNTTAQDGTASVQPKNRQNLQPSPHHLKERWYIRVPHDCDILSLQALVAEALQVDTLLAAKGRVLGQWQIVSHAKVGGYHRVQATLLWMFLVNPMQDVRLPANAHYRQPLEHEDVLRNALSLALPGLPRQMRCLSVCADRLTHATAMVTALSVRMRREELEAKHDAAALAILDDRARAARTPAKSKSSKSHSPSKRHLEVEEVGAVSEEHDTAQRTQMELAVLGVTDEQAVRNIEGLQESGARGLWELAMLRPFPKHVFDKGVLQLLVTALTHSPCARAVQMALGAVWALLPYQEMRASLLSHGLTLALKRLLALEPDLLKSLPDNIRSHFPAVAVEDKMAIHRRALVCMGVLASDKLYRQELFKHDRTLSTILLHASKPDDGGTDALPPACLVSMEVLAAMLTRDARCRQLFAQAGLLKRVSQILRTHTHWGVKHLAAQCLAQYARDTSSMHHLAKSGHAPEVFRAALKAMEEAMLRLTERAPADPDLHTSAPTSSTLSSASKPSTTAAAAATRPLDDEPESEATASIEATATTSGSMSAAAPSEEPLGEGCSVRSRACRRGRDNLPSDPPSCVLEHAAGAVWGAAVCCLRGGDGVMTYQHILQLVQVAHQTAKLATQSSRRAAMCLSGCFAALMQQPAIALRFTHLAQGAVRDCVLNRWPEVVRLAVQQRDRLVLMKRLQAEAVAAGLGQEAVLNVPEDPIPSRAQDLWARIRQEFMPLAPRGAYEALLSQAGQMRCTAVSALSWLALHEAAHFEAHLHDPQPPVNSLCNLLVQSDLANAILDSRHLDNNPSVMGVLDQLCAAGVMYMTVAATERPLRECKKLVDLMDTSYNQNGQCVQTHAGVLQLATASAWCLCRSHSQHRQQLRASGAVRSLCATVERMHPQVAALAHAATTTSHLKSGQSSEHEEHGQQEEEGCESAEMEIPSSADTVQTPYTDNHHADSDHSETEPDHKEEMPDIRPKLVSAPGWDSHSTKPACLLASEFAVAALWSLLKDEVEERTLHGATADEELSDDWQAGMNLLVQLVRRPQDSSVWLVMQLLAVRALWDMAVADEGARKFYLGSGVASFLFNLASQPHAHTTLRNLATKVVGVLSGCEDYKVDPAEDSYLLQEVTAEELRKKEVRMHEASLGGKFCDASDFKRLRIIGRNIAQVEDEILDLKTLHLDSLGKLAEVEGTDQENLEWWAAYAEDLQGRRAKLEGRLGELRARADRIKSRSVLPMSPRLMQRTACLQLDALDLLLAHLKEPKWQIRAAGAYGLARLSQTHANKSAFLVLKVISAVSDMLHDNMDLTCAGGPVPLEPPDIPDPEACIAGRALPAGARAREGVRQMKVELRQVLPADEEGLGLREARQYALAVLLNMSTVSKAQLIIASQALYAVLRVLYAPPELEATDPSLTKARYLGGLVLSNISTHVNARNMIYRSELRLKGVISRGGLTGKWWRSEEIIHRKAAEEDPLAKQENPVGRFLHWQSTELQDAVNNPACPSTDQQSVPQVAKKLRPHSAFPFPGPPPPERQISEPERPMSPPRAPDRQDDASEPAAGSLPQMLRRSVASLWVPVCAASGSGETEPLRATSPQSSSSPQQSPGRVKHPPDSAVRAFNQTSQNSGSPCLSPGRRSPASRPRSAMKQPRTENTNTPAQLQRAIRRLSIYTNPNVKHGHERMDGLAGGPKTRASLPPPPLPRASSASSSKSAATPKGRPGVQEGWTSGKYVSQPPSTARRRPRTALPVSRGSPTRAEGASPRPSQASTAGARSRHTSGNQAGNPTWTSSGGTAHATFLTEKHGENSCCIPKGASPSDRQRPHTAKPSSRGGMGNAAVGHCKAQQLRPTSARPSNRPAGTGTSAARVAMHRSLQSSWSPHILAYPQEKLFGHISTIHQAHEPSASANTAAAPTMAPGRLHLEGREGPRRIFRAVGKERNQPHATSLVAEASAPVTERQVDESETDAGCAPAKLNGNRSLWRRVISPLARVGVPMAKGLADARASSTSSNEPEVVKVVLEPANPRNRVNFNKPVSASRMMVVRLVAFEHTKGSKVYQGLFPTYTLPNGSSVHFFDPGAKLVDEMEIEQKLPTGELGPITLGQIYQIGLPLPVVLLRQAAEPKLSVLRNMELPIPMVCSRPEGPQELPMDNKHWTPHIHAELSHEEKLQKATDQVLTFDMFKCVGKWSPAKSVLASRPQENPSRDFYDSSKIALASYESDMKQLAQKSRFMDWLDRTVVSANKLAEKMEKTAKESKKEGDAAVSENQIAPPVYSSTQEVWTAMKKLLWEEYEWLVGAMQYYACFSSADPRHLDIDGFTKFVLDASLAHAELKTCRLPDLKQIFIAAKARLDHDSVNVDEDLMVRSFWMEAMVRIAMARFGGGVHTWDHVNSLKLLLQHLKNSLPPVVFKQRNTFRSDHLYQEDTDLCLKLHLPVLQVVFDRERLTDPEDGQGSCMTIKQFVLFVERIGALVEPYFTRTEAKHCAIMSISPVVREDDPRGVLLTWCTFLEAFCRVAQVRCEMPEFCSPMPPPTPFTCLDGINSNWWRKHETEEANEKMGNIVQIIGNPANTKSKKKLRMISPPRLEIPLDPTTTPRGTPRESSTPSMGVRLSGVLSAKSKSKRILKKGSETPTPSKDKESNTASGLHSPMGLVGEHAKTLQQQLQLIIHLVYKEIDKEISDINKLGRAKQAEIVHKLKKQKAKLVKHNKELASQTRDVLLNPLSVTAISTPHLTTTVKKASPSSKKIAKSKSSKMSK